MRLDDSSWPDPVIVGIGLPRTKLEADRPSIRAPNTIASECNHRGPHVVRRGKDHMTHDNPAGRRQGGSARLRSFGCDHVRDLRRTLQLETLHLHLQHPVSIGDPLVLAQMLEPTVEQKRFDEA